MSSRKKQPEGIALLSMYSDVDDETDDFEDKRERELFVSTNFSEPGVALQESIAEDDFVVEATTLMSEHMTSSNGDLSRSFNPQQPRVFFSWPNEQQEHLVRLGKRRGEGRPTIVDYAHDELPVSPELEEGEYGGGDFQNFNGIFQGNTLLKTIQVLSFCNHSSFQSLDYLEPSQHDDMTTIFESEAVQIEATIKPDVNPLETFLPLSSNEKIAEDLINKMHKFIHLKKAGRSFNAEVRGRKDYRNPDFLLHAVGYQGIDQIGSCFSNDIFNPHGYDKNDFYDAIEADMRHEREKKEQELKKSPKVEFLSGGSQLGQVPPPPTQFNIPFPAQVAGDGLSSAASSDAIANNARDGKQNKKSKWDKVDGDVGNLSSTFLFWT